MALHDFIVAADGSAVAVIQIHAGIERLVVSGAIGIKVAVKRRTRPVGGKLAAGHYHEHLAFFVGKTKGIGDRIFGIALSGTAGAAESIGALIDDPVTGVACIIGDSHGGQRGFFHGIVRQDGRAGREGFAFEFDAKGGALTGKPEQEDFLRIRRGTEACNAADGGKPGRHAIDPDDHPRLGFSELARWRNETACSGIEDTEIAAHGFEPRRVGKRGAELGVGQQTGGKIPVGLGKRGARDGETGRIAGAQDDKRIGSDFQNTDGEDAPLVVGKVARHESVEYDGAGGAGNEQQRQSGGEAKNRKKRGTWLLDVH